MHIEIYVIKGADYEYDI